MKKKLLLTSILSIVMCLSLIAGATFALFTSESTVNVAVTSGKVCVKATVDSFEYKTLNQDWTTATDNKTTFDNIGGSAELKDGQLKLNGIVPGDGVRFAINVKNESSVNVKCKTTIKSTNDSNQDLFDALIFTVDGEDFSGTRSSGWNTIAPTTIEVSTINVVIELPEGVDGAELMDVSCAVDIVVNAVQGNAKVDEPQGDGYEKIAEGLFLDTANDNYLITNADGLDTMRSMVADEETYDDDGMWSLYNNIDLNGINWTPINGFHGTFDGSGYTISNLTVSTDGVAGLFGKNNLNGDGTATEPIIKNLTISNANVKGNEGVAVVVGNMGYAAIEKVTVIDATVNGNKYVGGIIGTAYTTGGVVITNCSVIDSTVKAEGENANGKVGGIGGFVALGTVTGNKVEGCTISGPECVGGIVGRGGSGETSATIYGNSVSGNTVTGTDTATVGEVIGDKLNVKENE